MASRRDEQRTIENCSSFIQRQLDQIIEIIDSGRITRTQQQEILTTVEEIVYLISVIDPTEQSQELNGGITNLEKAAGLISTIQPNNPSPSQDVNNDSSGQFEEIRFWVCECKPGNKGRPKLNIPKAWLEYMSNEGYARLTVTFL